MPEKVCKTDVWNWMKKNIFKNYEEYQSDHQQILAKWIQEIVFFFLWYIHQYFGEMQKYQIRKIFNATLCDFYFIIIIKAHLKENDF